MKNLTLQDSWNDLQFGMEGVFFIIKKTNRLWLSMQVRVCSWSINVHLMCMDFWPKNILVEENIQ